MFAIGEFARYGRVTIRVLRHYDAIGLLGPVCVDPATGYRIYEAGQLSRLNRIVALKSLGFTLQQVATILDEQYQAHRGTAGRRTDQHRGPATSRSSSRRSSSRCIKNLRAGCARHASRLLVLGWRTTKTRAMTRGHQGARRAADR